MRRRALAWSTDAGSAPPDFTLDDLMGQVSSLPQRKRADEAPLAACVAVQRLVQAALEPDARLRADHLQSTVAFAARALAFSRSKKSAAACAELAPIVRAQTPAPSLADLSRASWMRIPGLDL